jgi:hypothetical protein
MQMAGVQIPVEVLGIYSLHQIINPFWEATLHSVGYISIHT